VKKGSEEGGRESSDIDVHAPTSSVMQEPKDDGRWSSLEFFAIAKRSIRGRVLYAENPNTPVEALHQLANDHEEFVRETVAENPNTPVEALHQLANDDDVRVRRHVARNPNTPARVFTQILESFTSGSEL
jgi:hypothetical protein